MGNNGVLLLGIWSIIKMPAYDLAGYSLIIMIIACCESKIFLSQPAGTKVMRCCQNILLFSAHLFKHNGPTQCW